MTCKFHINIDSHCQRIWIQGFKRKYHHSDQYSVSVFESLAIVKDITRHDKPIRHSHTHTDSPLSNNIWTSVSYTAFRTHYVPLCEVSIKWGRLKEGTNENVTRPKTPYETTIMNEYLIIPKVKERKLT